MVFSYDWIQIFQIPFNSFEAIIQFFLNCITVVALVHNYLTGVAIAVSAELAEITNTMSDSYITFIDTPVNYKLSNWGFYVASYRLFQN
ncbi:hypothetical protein T05_1531 [Trichinella murrelli]|uniref:Uncharacterized protein n=1 Tax=Trichinella murrelli TaxID=144512 RepID=A0A0V0UCS5_9BILA|nr:hypothetical protein T05_1531 [Trichinella murrelli]